MLRPREAGVPCPGWRHLIWTGPCDVYIRGSLRAGADDEPGHPKRISQMAAEPRISLDASVPTRLFLDGSASAGHARKPAVKGRASSGAGH